MTMMELRTAFVLILFAGYAMAQCSKLAMFNATQNTTTVYKEGSSATTLKPILPVDEDGKDLVGRLKRLIEDYTNYETKASTFLKNVRENDFNSIVVQLTKFTHSLPKTKNAEPCSEFAINRGELKGALLNFADLMVESSRIKVRVVERNLEIVGESIPWMNSLSGFSGYYCKDLQNILCFPGMTGLIETKATYYEQLAKSINKDLIDIETDRISDIKRILIEGVYRQSAEVMKNYFCCLKGAAEQATQLGTQLTTSKTLPSIIFQCANGDIIVAGKKCNGWDDCGDNSDETHCK